MMLRFFRRIRHKLMAENKIGKYFLYALGEIILVVLGILIALQVNNRNEAKKARAQEIILLENIKKDLNLDTLDIGFNLQYHKAFITEEKKFLNFLNSDLIQPSDLIDYNGALSAPLVIVLHESTFTNVQNNDIGLLSNNELRKEISRFYDFFNKAIQKVENDKEVYEAYTLKLPYFLKYFKLDPDAPPMVLSNPNSDDYYNPDFQKQSIIIEDIPGAKQDEAFKIVMNESIFFRQIKIDFYIDMVNRINELSQKIDQELEILVN